MMVKRINKPILALLAAFTFLFVSCEQKDLYDPTYTLLSPDPSTIDFATDQHVKFNLSYANVPQGYAAKFDLYDADPCVVNAAGNFVLKSGVTPIASGISVSGKFTNTKSLPGYVTKLYAYSKDIFVSPLMYAEITGNQANFSVVKPVATTGRAVTRNASDGLVDLYLGQYGDKPDVDATGAPNYIDPTMQVDITAATLQKINAAFPNEVQVNSAYVQDASLYIQQKAEIWISILVSEGVFVNEFAYFCYDGPKTDLASMSKSQREELKVISVFPKAKVNSDVNLHVGDYVKLKYYNKETGALEDEFPAGTTIGWVLLPIAYGTYMGDSFYSCPSWNPESTAALRNHTIYFNAGTAENPFVCFGFEDMRNDGNWGYRDQDCNDMMFNVQLNPINALDPPPVIEDPDPIEGSQKYFGYLGFEDYWPQFFDYDMNDLLVKYISDVSTIKYEDDNNVYVTKIEDEFIMVFTGADFNNKFGYQTDMSPSLIEKITIDDGTGAQELPVSTLEGDRGGFIVDICPGAGSIITPYDYNVTPKVYKLSIQLKDKALTMSNFENNNYMAPYNPFITPIAWVIGRNGEIEVHLPGYMPTVRALRYTEWFGHFDDRSNYNGNGIYYVGGNELLAGGRNIFPFAIHLSGIENFYIPCEHKDISYTYPRYTNWIETEKAQDKDWYLYPDRSVHE